MKLKKILALALASVMALSAVACGSKTPAANNTPAETEAPEVYVPNTKTTDETLTVSIQSEPASIFGTIAGESDNANCLMQVVFGDTLVALDNKTGVVSPRLATAWEWVDDYRLQFTLRDDVTFTNGQKMTAEDVKYTFDTLAEVAANGDAGRYLDPSKNEVVDEKTVILGFNTKAPDLLAMLSWSIFPIFCEAEVEAAGGLDQLADKPVCGTGRYIFKEWANGQYVTFERNDNYWDKDYKGYYKTIKFVFAADGAAREMAIEAGDVQVTCEIDIAQAATYKKNNTKVKTMLDDFGQVYHLWYNMYKEGPMQDIRVRQAIDKALDFDAIAAYASGGYAQPALGYISDYVPFSADYYTADERKQDIEGAKALLKEAGYENMEITCVGLADTEGLYTVIQGQLAQVGITLKIETVDVPTFVGKVAFKDAADYDLVVVGEYLENRNPSIFTFFRQANIDAFTIGGPKMTTPEIEACIDEIIAAPDMAAAKAGVEKIEAIFKEGMWVTNLCTQLKTTVTALNIKGLTFRERGMMDVTTFYAE